MPAIPVPCETISTVSASQPNLEGHLGETVQTFCGKYGTVSDGISHCAHWVSHVLELRIPGAALCSNVGGGTYTYEQRREGYCVRVNEIFNSCTGRAYWDFDKTQCNCFIIATVKANVANTDPVTIGRMENKHIGFHLNGNVYHYSNRQDQVVKQTVAEFKNHYGKGTVLLRADLP
jgi:hypothetical protein